VRWNILLKISQQNTPVKKLEIFGKYTDKSLRLAFLAHRVNQHFVGAINAFF